MEFQRPFSLVTKIFSFIFLYLKVDTVCLFFGRAERSFFAQGHVKVISFIPLRDILLRFNFLNLIFSAPTGRFYLILV